MAGEIPDLHAQERTGTGKGAARQARRDGLVPVSFMVAAEIRWRSIFRLTSCSSA